MTIITTSLERTTRVLAIILVLTNLSQSQQTRAAQSDGASRYARVYGIRVHYESHGTGREAIVLIHGWTCNLGFWKQQIPDLTKRARVVAIDLPGHGKSDKPKTAYTMDLFARAVDAVMQDAGVDRGVLVGHSMGTPVARQFSRKYPQKTLGLVVVDGPLRPFGDKKMMDDFIAPLRGPDYKTQAGQFIDGMLGPQVSAALREQIKTSMLSTPQYVAISAMEGMNEESNWKQDKIDVPVLAVLAKSPFWPADNEQFFRSVAPKLDYQMWDGVSHFLMMEKPKEFNAAVIAFVDKRALLKK
ncbi:MAG TPA: alpha/beta hydrolase [Blastocatellia bacterium]|nr:alpha/beta hydrolase [Blastocatellia bacterium]